jgi:hypothetical protein
MPSDNVPSRTDGGTGGVQAYGKHAALAAPRGALKPALGVTIVVVLKFIIVERRPIGTGDYPDGRLEKCGQFKARVETHWAIRQ